MANEKVKKEVKKGENLPTEFTNEDMDALKERLPFLKNHIDVETLPSLEVFTKETTVTADYLKLEDGETKKFWFVGMGEMKNTKGDGMVPVCRLYSKEDEKHYIFASAVVVGSLEPISNDCPIPISITKTGKEIKGKQYDYDEYIVSILS